MPYRDRAHRASCFVISITPFTADGALDEGAFREHMRRLADSGIGVYVGGGGSGEGYTLSREDNARIFAVAVEELKGRVPVRAMGVEPRTAAQMLDFLRLAADAGMEAAQVYSLDVGHGHGPTNEELETYFDEVIAAAPLPVVLSTHQSVGYRIAPELIVSLAARPQVLGVNCTHPDLGYLATVIDGVAPNKDVHVGGPMQGLTALAFGGQGYLCSEGNLAPKLCVSVIDHYKAGNLDAMMDAFSKVVRLSTGLYGNGGIRVTKAVLNQLGLPGGYPRKPRLPVTDDR
ncbi:MAG TPA: dihydrodipicolinate synthase family protein, partial [Stellaceae bacterium]|nr:dihydrodipicolinate synthase family protein [Stellaceae bacterium]